MSYVPGFAYDLFVSYASDDNAGEWVERFQSHLTGELTRLLGRPFSEKTIYFDKLRLRVGQAYPEELDNAAHQSAMLVALLSPSYAASDWCSRERTEFTRRLPPGSSFAQFLAAVRVRPTTALPEHLATAQRIDFVKPGTQEPWPVASDKWTEQVNQFAAEMKIALQTLRLRAGSVFVGEPLKTHFDLRANLVDYLSQQNFRAAPDPPALLDDLAQCQTALAQSPCGVHFIGGASDPALDRIDASIQYCPGETVLFQPFGARLTAVEEEFLVNLPNDRYPHRITGTDSELKTFLGDLLTRKQAPAHTPASLSLVCDAPDFGWAQQFKVDGLTVSYPAFLLEKQPTMERVRKWRQLVKDSHGLLFYQGQTLEPVLDRIWRIADDEKSNALRRWYLAEPDLDEKRKKRPAEPRYDEGLHEWLAQVRQRAQGAV